MSLQFVELCRSLTVWYWVGSLWPRSRVRERRIPGHLLYLIIYVLWPRHLNRRLLSLCLSRPCDSSGGLGWQIRLDPYEGPSSATSVIYNLMFLTIDPGPANSLTEWDTVSRILSVSILPLTEEEAPLTRDLVRCPKTTRSKYITWDYFLPIHLQKSSRTFNIPCT